MTMFILGLILGLMIGGLFGIAIMCLLIVSGKEEI